MFSSHKAVTVFDLLIALNSKMKKCCLLVVVILQLFTIFFNTVKPAPTAISDADIQNLVNKLVNMDVDSGRANVDFVLNYQNKTTYDADKDVCSLPLFSFVNETLFNRPTYQVFFNLRNEFNPDVTQAEQNSTQKTQNIENFLDTIMKTDQFNTAWQFLQSYNVVSSDYNTFKDQLRTLWFGLYSRADNVLGSSGWEHVFLGEWKTDGEVDGLHNWVQYYELEKTKDINYYGYLEYEGDVLPTLQYTWEKYIKPEGSFMLGACLEFNFSVFTVCFLTKQGSYGCKFTLGGYPIAVTSYSQDAPGGPYIATTYPEDGSG